MTYREKRKLLIHFTVRNEYRPTERHIPIPIRLYADYDIDILVAREYGK